MTLDSIYFAPPAGKSRRPFVLGLLLASGLLVVGAEVFLHHFPMRDLHLYLGKESPLDGPFVADPDWVVAYSGWDEFAADNEKSLAPHLPLKVNPDGRPVWAFFGNSFVQDPGALAESAKARVTDRRVFHLGRLEQLEVRLAQIRLLLEHGLEPERLFVELMPVDTLRLGPHPLSTTRVSPRGAITYVPALPPGLLGQLIGKSRLALTARIRLGAHKGNRRYNMLQLYDRVEEPLLGDLRKLFGNLVRLTREKRVATTICMLPDYSQVTARSGWAFQDVMTPIMRELGFDVFDPREVFLSHHDPLSLFLPCGHFNAKGNAILIAELLRHLESRKSEHTASKEKRP